ncbi:MAG: PEP-CTERM sorting domain-containing protein [Microcystis viridis Mv_BB_P_19951000_S69]|uniref:PEP-CTERM sorting domain-containing protein n=1 Tax=Microcystis viridis Mv_BB_P_19951000_S68D TaxID=2486270 RepID=A0A552HXX3_MICVR|nr:MAG: PEP-CTERM sorting domain-containing protein [Microcystis viridis Mv_BB_P_19951000_S69]TRU76028.1 MAG: PEP-CTERM sorting domain-containing protein [Microcystis viridis Mv_BB_P_19951000_S68D]TRU77272.1 MAG: PEP-CTERM sorting domain-containing protein [Microcystis viridis Mv_BB_P_19951000_S68]TRU86891.1 MAG: PEP-CTERM sorting domain-containing protein [Microcystis viridis Mv_BB_P_19951000_S69D]
MNAKLKNSAFDKLKLAPIALAAGVGMMLAAAPAQAAVVTLAQTVTQGGVVYSSIRNSTLSSPLTLLPGATGSSAYGISDAAIVGGRGDAFDGFAGITVNGAAFNQPNFQVDLTTTGAGTFVNTISPVNLGGINTSLDYFMSASSPTLRVFGTFTNTTANPLSAAIAYGGDLGCDDDCIIEDSSTGDNTFQSALDRWFITSDGPSDSDPFLTFVRFGPGGQLASSTPAVPGEDFNGALDNFGDIWTLSLASGETKSLMWFANFNDSLAEAQAGTSVFNNLSTLDASDLLEGLSPTQIGQTANWKQTPEPSSLIGLGSLLGFGLLSKIKRRNQKKA